MKATVSEFGHRLFHEWQHLLLPQLGASVIVAVSGGADSVALLLAVDELKRAGLISIEIVVAHLDHCLRCDSTSDAEWVLALSNELGVANVSEKIDVGRLAQTTSDNIEQAARLARY